MSDRSAIEWTDATWNPIRARGELGRHFCLKISDGCTNCYASSFTRRLGGRPYDAANSLSIAGAAEAVRRRDIYLDEQALTLPLKWKRPRRIFVASMTDLFGEWVPTGWLERIFDVMTSYNEHGHTFQVLTKRPARMRTFLTNYPRWQTAPRSRDTIWLGVTVESDAYAWRAKMLAEIPAAVRFVSAEPLLGPLPSLHLDRIDWLIVGGESGGPLERRLVRSSEQSLSWVRDLRDRAQAAGVAFLFKQWGGPTPKASGRLLDGRDWLEFPTAREEVRA